MSTQTNCEQRNPSLSRGSNIRIKICSLDETHVDIKACRHPTVKNFKCRLRNGIMPHESLVEKMLSEISTALKDVDFNIEDLDGNWGRIDEEMGVKIYSVASVVSERYGITSPLLKCHAIIRCIYIERHHDDCGERLSVLLKVFLQTLFEEYGLDNTDSLPFNRIIETGYVFLTHTSNFLFNF